MRRSIFSLALFCIPLALAGCVTDDEMPDDSVGGETTEGDTDDPTGDTDATDGETDGESDTEGDDGGCNVESPYAMGGWDIGCCQDTIVPTAWSPGAVGVGSVLPDWTLQNQYGESVRLYDFCHDAIYFEYSAVW